MKEMENTMSKRQTKNAVIADHGEYLEIDISTKKHPAATMAVDAEVWAAHEGGRVYACKASGSYIYAKYHEDYKNKYFHIGIIDVSDGLEIDHCKHCTMSFVDNRRSNLRAVTRSQNLMNRRIQSRSKSGITGVYWVERDQKWQVQITVDEKLKSIGAFANKQDAIDVRKAAEIKYFGDFAFDGGK
jgi:hypothetical protein